MGRREGVGCPGVLVGWLVGWSVGLEVLPGVEVADPPSVGRGVIKTVGMSVGRVVPVGTVEGALLAVGARVTVATTVDVAATVDEGSAAIGEEVGADVDAA